MDDTPLVRIISIRSEIDRERIKNFSSSEKKIRNDWIKFRNNQRMTSMTSMTNEQKEKQVLTFQEAMKKAFWKGGKK